MKFNIGAHIDKPASSLARRTGTWADRRPIIDKKKCIKCGNCWLFCPDGAVRPIPGGYFKVNENYCKGCGICAIECPVQAIKMVSIR